MLLLHDQLGVIYIIMLTFSPRYCLLSYILCIRRFSSRLKKRFPDMQVWHSFKLKGYYKGLFNFGVQSKIWWVTKFGKNDWNPSIGWPNEHLTPKKCFEQPPASENSINRSKILLFTKRLIFERIFQMLSQPYTTLKYGVSYTVGKV